MTPTDQGPERTGTALSEMPAMRVAEYLDEHGIEHELIEHEATGTALAEARESGARPEITAKGVLLSHLDGFLLAVIPASHRVDLRKVRELTGADDLRLAVEDEMRIVAPLQEIGTLPPIGPDLPAPELFDRRLLEHEQIICNSGDHRHSLRLDPAAIVDAVKPRLGDLCED